MHGFLKPLIYKHYSLLIKIKDIHRHVDIFLIFGSFYEKSTGIRATGAVFLPSFLWIRKFACQIMKNLLEYRSVKKNLPVTGTTSDLVADDRLKR